MLQIFESEGECAGLCVSGVVWYFMDVESIFNACRGKYFQW